VIAMLSDKLLKILVDPVTKDNLLFENNLLLNKKNGNVYPIEESAAILLPKKYSNTLSKSDAHKKFDSEFDYIDHYQKDSEYFDYFQDFESGASRHENIRVQDQIIQLISNESKYILDVGCGRAWVAKRLLSTGADILSMDVSKNNPIKAIRKYPGSNHHALVADVFFLPIKENSIDCIVASEVIEHVPAPNEFVSNLFKILKPGGKLIVSTPYKEKIEYYLCVHCNRPTPKNAHLHTFNTENIKSLSPENSILKQVITLNNKYLLKLRTHLILQYLPFPFWRFVDKLANVFNNASKCIIFVIEKPV